MPSRTDRRASVSGDYTPFGFLRNPGHRATSWRQATGGNLLTPTDYVGMEWAYPVAREPRTRVGLGLETLVDGRPCRSRADFEALGLTSAYHSCQILGFDWLADGVRVSARYFLAADDALCVRLSAVNEAPTTRSLKVGIVGCVDGRALPPADDHQPLAWLTGPRDDEDDEVVVHCLVRPADQPGPGIEGNLAFGETRRLTVVLGRGPDAAAALAAGRLALASAELTYAHLLDEDARFWATCPTLSGDWPAHWPAGLVYDFETTRLLVQPARGIFADVWPSWMAGWPRVVLAEGVLDMLRLAYADPLLAQRAVLSLFRDAAQPNVPCVFENGEATMVAVDGSRCGTSPAWCLPFLNLELLYLRTLDRRWLAELYPYASAFVSWWLEHRVDAEGWAVYKCTWESGEDGNPRLDPTGSGDADISERVRPVELQATLSQAAGVLAFFATELGYASDVAHWRHVSATFRDRTRALFDAESGRYRDWLVADGAFQASHSEHVYWGIDPFRHSAQSLTPLLIGEPLDPAEVWRHAAPPWTLWPSWTWTLIESAAAAGLIEGVGRLAFETVDRVYRVTTRRSLELTRPLPGGAPEFWPLDWLTYAGSDAYGWGATTANLLIRHLFGFKESRRTDGWVAELAPALPAALLASGRRFGIHHLNYRGLVFDLSYAVQADGLELEVELDLGDASHECSVEGTSATVEPVYASTQRSSRHRFRLEAGRAYTLRLG